MTAKVAVFCEVYKNFGQKLQIQIFHLPTKKFGIPIAYSDNSENRKLLHIVSFLTSAPRYRITVKCGAILMLPAPGLQSS